MFDSDQVKTVMRLKDDCKATEWKGELSSMSKGVCTAWLFESVDSLYDGYTVNVGHGCYSFYHRGVLFAGIFPVGDNLYHAYLALQP